MAFAKHDDDTVFQIDDGDYDPCSDEVALFFLSLQPAQA